MKHSNTKMGYLFCVTLVKKEGPVFAVLKMQR